MKSHQICQFFHQREKMTRDHYCIVLLLLALGVSLCKSIGLYPNITLPGTGTPEITPINTLFIYSWTADDQAKLPGYVTAFEYCFQRTTLTPARPVFSFLLLQRTPTGYEVLQNIDVMTQDFTSCSNRGGVDTCCLRQPLQQSNWFKLPVPTSGGYGIFSTGKNRILGADPELTNFAVGLQIPSDRKDDIRINTKVPLTTINYRLFNMVIGNVTMPTPTSKTVHGSNISNGMETHPQMPWTETTLTMSTDGEATNLPDDRPTGSLSTMAMVEIVLGCIIFLMFSGSLLLWVILCYKVRAMRRVRNLPNPMDSQRNHHACQPVYDSIFKMHENTNGNGALIEFFHRNPAYAYQGTQIEPKKTKKIVKIHHDWLIG